MEMQSTIPAFVSAADLTRVQSFHIGLLLVDPPTRSIAMGDRSATLEPRVMQVLVALGSEPGQVLSRDDLIALAWDGRIVGDNAVSRVISMLRQALVEVAGEAVKLETINKVGFRILTSAPTATPDRSARKEKSMFAADRRGWMLGAGAAALAAAVGGWSLLRQPRHDPRATELLKRADLLMKSGLPGSIRQATRNLEEAVALAPEYADAWGYLALMYRHAMNGHTAGESRNLAAMMDSAAKRALSIEPSQPDALLAQALDRPFYRNWLDSEARLRALADDHPDHWYVNAQLALLLMDVGRAAEALAFRERVIRIDPQIPVAWALLAINRLHANRLHEADKALDLAFTQWPNHPALWGSRYRVLLETGRPLEAAQFVQARRSRPDGVPDQVVADAARDAEAIASSDSAGIEPAVDRTLSNLAEPEAGEDAAPMLAMLGRPDLALRVARAYFLGGQVEGNRWPDPDAAAARSTSLLFFPSFLQFAGSPEFTELLDGSGLSDYWKRSGSQPDFRRG